MLLERANMREAREQFKASIYTMNDSVLADCVAYLTGLVQSRMEDLQQEVTVLRLQATLTALGATGPVGEPGQRGAQGVASSRGEIWGVGARGGNVPRGALSEIGQPGETGEQVV